MAAPTIPNGETQFFPIIYEGTEEARGSVSLYLSQIMAR